MFEEKIHDSQSETIRRIGALSDERRRLCMDVAMTPAERSNLLQAVDQELAGLWDQRRTELATVDPNVPLVIQKRLIANLGQHAKG